MEALQYPSMHRWEAGSRGRTAKGEVCLSSSWQSAEPSRCYGGWQATIDALAICTWEWSNFVNKNNEMCYQGRLQMHGTMQRT
jgi:hypothetical protein